MDSSRSRVPRRLAVLASGGGSNLQALIDRFNAADDAPARVVLVVASRPDAGALRRADEAGIETAVVDARAGEHGDQVIAALRGAGAEWVVLAGWMHHLPASVVDAFRGRLINIHPSLLPAFGGAGMYGARVHRAVLAAGVRVTGATVHHVDEGLDTGAIIAQYPVPVLPGDTAETLARRVVATEHRLLPAALEALLGLPAADQADNPIEPQDTAFRLVPEAVPLGESVTASVRAAFLPSAPPPS